MTSVRDIDKPPAGCVWATTTWGGRYAAFGTAYGGKGYNAYMAGQEREASNSQPVPASPPEWVRRYRQRRRRQLGSEEAFRRHVRIVWKHSGFVKQKGWKPEQLAAALDQVEGESTAGSKRDPAGEVAADDHDEPQASESAPLAPGPGRRCIGCGAHLPADRQRTGRCQPCRQRRQRETARDRKRHQRTKPERCRVTRQKAVEGRSCQQDAARSDDLCADRVYDSFAP